MRYLVPRSLDDAMAAMAEAPLTVLAGGTDIYPALRDRPLTRDTLDIGRIAGLRGIDAQEDGWRIGAGTTWTDVINAQLPAAFDGLKLAAREVGSVQIQNAATLAGNICNASPAADGVPCLLTLDARVELCSTSGMRVLPLRDFITGVRQTARRPDELVTAILIPPQRECAQGNFVKLGARKYLVISLAMVASVVTVEDGIITEARISVGSCSPVAERLSSLEADLTGLPVDTVGNAITPDHLQPLAPIDDVRGTADYRLEAVRELIVRCLTGPFCRKGTG